MSGVLHALPAAGAEPVGPLVAVRRVADPAGGLGTRGEGRAAGQGDRGGSRRPLDRLLPAAEGDPVAGAAGLLRRRSGRGLGRIGLGLLATATAVAAGAALAGGAVAHGRGRAALADGDLAVDAVDLLLRDRAAGLLVAAAVPLAAGLAAVDRADQRQTALGLDQRLLEARSVRSGRRGHRGHLGLHDLRDLVGRGRLDLVVAAALAEGPAEEQDGADDEEERHHERHELVTGDILGTLGPRHVLPRELDALIVEVCQGALDAEAPAILGAALLPGTAVPTADAHLVGALAGSLGTLVRPPLTRGLVLVLPVALARGVRDGLGPQLLPTHLRLDRVLLGLLHGGELLAVGREVLVDTRVGVVRALGGGVGLLGVGEGAGVEVVVAAGEGRDVATVRRDARVDLAEALLDAAEAGVDVGVAGREGVVDLGQAALSLRETRVQVVDGLPVRPHLALERAGSHLLGVEGRAGLGGQLLDVVEAVALAAGAAVEPVHAILELVEVGVQAGQLLPVPGDAAPVGDLLVGELLDGVGVVGRGHVGLLLEVEGRIGCGRPVGRPEGLSHWGLLTLAILQTLSTEHHKRSEINSLRVYRYICRQADIRTSFGFCQNEYPHRCSDGH